MQNKPSRISIIALSATLLALFSPLGNAAHAAENDRPIENGGQNSERVFTIEAVVVDEGDENQYEVEADGERFFVYTKGVKVRKGDEIVLKGTFDENDDFTPRSVQFMESEGTDRGRPNPNEVRPVDRDRPISRPILDNRVSFPATITRNLSVDEVEVRGGNGRLYRVQVSRDSELFRVGDEVRVEGRAVGMDVRDAILIPRNGGIVPPRADDAPAQTVDFPGKITRLNKTLKEATVRGDNGREYEVRGEELLRFGIGSHIRVRGITRAGVVQITRLDLWR